ncbi:GNAT family N-acetyltransferase [Clostridium nigeriense]|uniref:GNAT family N-acetyltransferase n=1 Tax=Clostridium nigeriense TaxID=1805470 RepID=UPI003D340A92
MNKIKLMVFSFNKRAISSYKKLGFREEALLKNEIYRNGKYYDEIPMAIFKDDWIK